MCIRDRIGNNALNRGYPASYTINSANTWEYKILSVTGDTSGTRPTDNTGGVRISWDWGNGSNFKGSAGAWASGDLRGGATGGTALCATSGATWQITGVQLEEGSQATPFEHEPYSVTLAKAQRYTYIIGDTQYQAIGHGTMYTATNGIFYVHTPVSMRSTPSISKTVDGNNVWLQSYVGASGLNTNASPQLGENSTNGRQNNFRVYVPSSNNSTTVGNSSWNQTMPNASLILNAEL